jgi:hypothetical protein
MKLAVHTLLFGLTATAAVRSVYTPLSGPLCKLVKEEKESGSTVHACPGPTPAIQTRVLYDDQRMSLTLYDPASKREAPLDLWTVVTKSFSSLGSKAEWRVAQTVTGLIVRVSATDSEGKVRSMLAVAKIDPKIDNFGQSSCVVEVIPASLPDANVRARRAADESAGKPCLSGEK